MSLDRQCFERTSTTGSFLHFPLGTSRIVLVGWLESLEMSWNCSDGLHQVQPQHHLWEWSIDAWYVHSSPRNSLLRNNSRNIYMYSSAHFPSLRAALQLHLLMSSHLHKNTIPPTTCPRTTIPNTLHNPTTTHPAAAGTLPGSITKISPHCPCAVVGKFGPCAYSVEQYC